MIWYIFQCMRARSPVSINRTGILLHAATDSFTDNKIYNIITLYHIGTIHAHTQYSIHNVACCVCVCVYCISMSIMHMQNELSQLFHYIHRYFFFTNSIYLSIWTVKWDYKRWRFCLWIYIHRQLYETMNIINILRWIIFLCVCVCVCDVFHYTNTLTLV